MQKKIIHIIILLFLVSSFTFSQDAEPVLIFSGRVTDPFGKKLDGVQVIVTKDNQPFKQGITSAGKYNAIEAPFGFVYSITFKKNGFVPKSLVLDAKKGFFKEDVEPQTFIEPSISLFLEEPDVDYSVVTSSPVGKARIDASTGKIDWDYTYLGQRKNEIDKYLKQVEDQAKLKESKFKKLVADGNNSFSKKDYSNAVMKFEEALKIKSDNLVSKQLANAQKNLELANAQNQKQKEYDDFIKTGDNSLSSSNYTSALDAYNKAKQLIPGNQIAYDKIKNIEKLQQEAKDKEIAEKFNIKMSAAKSSFDSKDYSKAIELYNEASKIDPSNRNPKERINEINSLLATQKSNEEDYNNLIAKADNQFTSKSYDDAISNYKRALKIKPDEAYPSEQISKVELEKKAEIEKGELEKKYNNIVKSADNQLKNLDYELAKKTYQKALEIKQSESYPQEKITYIDDKLKEILEEKNNQDQLFKNYQAKISEADKLFDESKFQEAIESYELAKNIKPDENYPDQKINEIKIKLTHIANQVKEKNQKYNDYIKSADAAFKSESWKLAKQFYNDAIAIDDSQKYPEDQLLIISQKINEKEKLEADSKQQLEIFNSLIKEGDQSIKNDNYNVAFNKYQDAQNLFPNNKMVKQKLNYLNNLINEKSKSNSIDSNYNELISKADEFRNNEKYEEAISFYNSAIKIKPLESYPKNQIKSINSKVLDISNNQIQSQYNEVIKKADEFLKDLSYDEALKKYNEANKISPKETYPLDKIREIKKLLIQKESKDNEYLSKINQADNEFESANWEDALVHYKAAKNIYEREHPTKRIEEINSKLNELKSQNDKMTAEKSKYDDIVNQGDQLYNEKKYKESKIKYAEALNLFKNEYYPKKKIAEIELILKEMEASEILLDQYNNLISKADALKLENKLEEAKILYEKAKNLIPSNPKSDEKILAINESLKQSNNDKLKIEYDKLIKKADDYFAAKNYKLSRDYYKQASSFEISNGANFSNGYASQKIISIDQLISEESNSKIDEQRQKAVQEKYDLMLQKAEDFKSKNQLSKSKEFFARASKLFPSESLPKQRISEIDQLIIDQLEKENKSKYDTYISKADQSFTDKNYDKSISFFRKAITVLPDENYPKEQIKKVSEAKIIALNNSEKQKQYNNLIKQGNRYFESKNYSMAIVSYQNASKIDSEQQLPRDKVVEINKIMDENSSKGLSNNQSILNTYSLLYGQEVTGKYSEDQVDIIMGTKSQVEVEMDEMNSEFKKDIQQQFAKKNNELQELKSNNQRQQINLFYQNIQKSFENSNDARWSNIPKVVDYKELSLYTKDELAYIGLDKIMRNHDNIEKQNVLREGKEVFRSEIIANNDLVTDNFYDQKSLKELEISNRANSVTYSNSISNEALNYEMELDNILKSNNNNLWIVGIDNYKQESSLDKETQMGHFKNLTYNNHISSENLTTLFNESSSNLDEPRIQKNIPAFGYYENDYFNSNASKRLNNIITTYNQFENSENLASKLNNFVINADDPRAQNSLKVDHYIDKEILKTSIWNDVSTDKLYNLHFLNDMYKDDLDISNEGKEDNRIVNVSDLENYNDSYFYSQGNSNQYDSDSDYLTAQFLDNSKSITVNHNSSKNIQKLAQFFPQGVTEKVYEQKDSNGDVVEVTIIRIVVKGNKGNEYKKVRSKWGIGYFKNGGVISQNTWDTESN